GDDQGGAGQPDRQGAHPRRGAAAGRPRAARRRLHPQLHQPCPAAAPAGDRRGAARQRRPPLPPPPRRRHGRGGGDPLLPPRTRPPAHLRRPPPPAPAGRRPGVLLGRPVRGDRRRRPGLWLRPPARAAARRRRPARRPSPGDAARRLAAPLAGTPADGRHHVRGAQAPRRGDDLMMTAITRAVTAAAATAKGLRGRLLLQVAGGLLALAFASALALAVLPEWRTGPLPDRQPLRARFQELIREAGLRPGRGRPSFSLMTRDASLQEAYAALGKRAPSWLAASRSAVRVALAQPVLLAGDPQDQEMRAEFALDGRPFRASWEETGSPLFGTIDERKFMRL